MFKTESQKPKYELNHQSDMSHPKQKQNVLNNDGSETSFNFDEQSAVFEEFVTESYNYDPRLSTSNKMQSVSINKRYILSLLNL